MYIYIYICLHTYADTQNKTHIHRRKHTFIYSCMRAYTCMSTCTQNSKQACIHDCTHTHTHLTRYIHASAFLLRCMYPYIHMHAYTIH